MPFPVPPVPPGRSPHHTPPTATSSTATPPTAEEAPTSPKTRLLRYLPVVVPLAVVVAVGLLVVFAPPAFADSSGAASLTSVIDNLRNWLVGILAAVATLFLTVGGLRYVTAGGDPGQIEKAKTALKSAAIGYALAALAPLLVTILASLFS